MQQTENGEVLMILRSYYDMWGIFGAQFDNGLSKLGSASGNALAGSAIYFEQMWGGVKVKVAQLWWVIHVF